MTPQTIDLLRDMVLSIHARMGSEIEDSTIMAIMMDMAGCDDYTVKAINMNVWPYVQAVEGAAKDKDKAQTPCYYGKACGECIQCGDPVEDDFLKVGLTC